jgi:putative DNA primase/helicase
MQAVETTTSSAVRVTLEPGGIPDELKGFSHWVLWCLEERDGELTKVPYSAKTFKHASTADSRSWSTFPEALEAYEESGNFDGIGFVLSSGDPFTGIDLDGVRAPGTGELTEWARKVIAEIGGYVEVSPSGKGVHIIVRARVSSRKGSGVEVYGVRRFFTMTGVKP